MEHICTVIQSDGVFKSINSVLSEDGDTQAAKSQRQSPPKLQEMIYII